MDSSFQDRDLFEQEARERTDSALMLKCVAQSAVSIYFLVFPFCLLLAHLLWLPIGPNPAEAATTAGYVVLALARVAVVTFWFLAMYWYVSLPVILLNAHFIAKRKRA